MKLGTSTVAIAAGVMLLLPSLTTAAKPVRTPIEDLFQIENMTIDESGYPVRITVEVRNLSSSITAGIWSAISYAHLCPDNDGLAGTMTPSVDCTTVTTAPNIEGTSSIPPGEPGTVVIEFPMSVVADQDYVFFTQVVCSGRGVRCDGYLHSFIGLDQGSPGQ